MKTTTMIVAVIALTVAAFCLNGAAALRAEELLPSLTFVVPKDEAHRKYLGLAGAPGETFSPADIKADILLIELFSMYCPFCQAEAPKVNELYELTREEESKGRVIRILGLGASNTEFEVKQFRDAFGIQFPLFPDKDLSMYKKLGGNGTPGFLGCKMQRGKDPIIVVRQSGGFETAEEFLSLLLQRAGY